MGKQLLVLALSMCFVKSKKIANNGDGLNTNIFTTFLLKKCLFIYTYWHFESAKKPNFRTKKAPYIGICQFKVLLLSGRPWVRIPPGRPKKPRNSQFFGLFIIWYNSLCNIFTTFCYRDNTAPDQISFVWKNGNPSDRPPWPCSGDVPLGSSL